MAEQAAGGTMTCPACRRKFPFKPQLEGKKVRCKCGTVFEGALDLEPDREEDDRTYDVAEDDAPAPPRVGVTITASPAASVPGAGAGPAGAGATVMPPDDGRLLSYAHRRPPPPDQEPREKSLVKELVMPVAFLALGGGLRVAQVVIESGGPGAGVGMAVGTAVLGVALNIGLTLAGVFAAAKLLGVDFGPIGELLLKVTATAVLGGAVASFVVSLSPKDMHGPVVALHVLVVLYWAMFYTFFDIDVQESLMTVAIVTGLHVMAFCVIFKPLG